MIAESPGRKEPVQHEVDALARRDHRRGGRVVDLADRVAERAGGVDDAAGGDGVLLPRFQVREHHPVDEALGVVGKPDDRGVVEQHRTLFFGGLGQVDQQPGVVELAVVVEDAAAQSVLLQLRDAGEHLFLPRVARLPEAVAESQHVVDLHADAVERGLPPGVVGHDEGQVMDQVRGILAENAAFLQRLHDEGHVALLEVAHAAVDELGGAAGSALAEVALLDQANGVAARGGIDGDADAGRPAADDGHVPGSVSGEEPFE